MERTEWVVRRLGPTDWDLAKIVQRINAANMEIDEPFTEDSLVEFLADGRRGRGWGTDRSQRVFVT